MNKRRSQLGDLPDDIGTDHNQLVDVPNIGAGYTEAQGRRQAPGLQKRPLPAWLQAALSLLVPYLFGSVSFTVRPFTVGTKSTKLTSGKKNRRYLLIQNNSGGEMYVNFDNEADSAGSVVISAGGYYEPFRVPDNAIYVSAASASSSGIMVEG